MSTRIIVSMAGAHDIVANGLRAILEQDPAVELLERSQVGTVPDVLLYDAVGIDEDGGNALERLVQHRAYPVVVIARDLRPDLAARALALGAVGCFSLESPGSAILETIHAAADGRLRRTVAHPYRATGSNEGLSVREVHALSGITNGMSNAEIARALGVSPNTLKTYIRVAYRKIGVTTRSQAVAWCLLHGFAPPSTRAPALPALGRTREVRQSS